MAKDPEVLLVSPCGFGIRARARAEAPRIAWRPVVEVLRE